MRPSLSSIIVCWRISSLLRKWFTESTKFKIETDSQDSRSKTSIELQDKLLPRLHFKNLLTFTVL